MRHKLPVELMASKDSKFDYLNHVSCHDHTMAIIWNPNNRNFITTQKSRRVENWIEYDQAEKTQIFQREVGLLGSASTGEIQDVRWIFVILIYFWEIESRNWIFLRNGQTSTKKDICRILTPFNVVFNLVFEAIYKNSKEKVKNTTRPVPAAHALSKQALALAPRY